MHRVCAYLKGVNLEQPKIQTHRFTLLWGKKPAPHGKIPIEVWMGGSPTIPVLDSGYIFNVNGPTADQKYPRRCDEWDDLQYIADPAAKNPEPICQPSITASTQFPKTTANLDGRSAYILLDGPASKRPKAVGAIGDLNSRFCHLSRRICIPANILGGEKFAKHGF